MKIHRIVYAGCGLSGRSSSLASVMRRVGLPVDAAALSHGEHRVHIGPGCVLMASISTTRAWLYYEDPTDPNLDPRIREEIDRLLAADGLIFVIDSQIAREEANLEHYENLARDLRSRRGDLQAKPIVFQANKRDLSPICSLDWIRENFHAARAAYVESIATKDIGTFEAVNELLKLMTTRNQLKS